MSAPDPAAPETGAAAREGMAVGSPLVGGELDNLLVEDPRSVPVYRLAELCRYDQAHAHQVARLALKLFDDLRALHGLGPEDRFNLQTAAILHDIGWVEGFKGHHKTAMRIIHRTTLLPFGHNRREVIGAVVRYHWKALPSQKHDHFAALSRQNQAVVLRLAGMLRLANALDRSHAALVTRLKCRLEHSTPDSEAGSEIIVYCGSMRRGEEEWAAARKHAKLLEKALQRKIAIVWLLEATEEAPPNQTLTNQTPEAPGD